MLIFYFLKSTIRHKILVYRIGRKLGGHWPRLLLHDLDRLINPRMFKAYLKYASGDYSDLRSQSRHFKKADHHWQYWMHLDDHGHTHYFDMPFQCIIEMVADWIATGIGKKGRESVDVWYEKHKDQILITDRNRVYVEALLLYYRSSLTS